MARLAGEDRVTGILALSTTCDSTNCNNGPKNAAAVDEFARREFNKNRRVIIRNVPTVTYNQVKSFMGRFIVADIAISRRQRHAIVTLLNGSEAEAAVSELNGTSLLGNVVEVSIYRVDNLLCVTALPMSVALDDATFRMFVEVNGTVEKSFLMRTADGLSKGYGFVEYAHNREQSELARCKLAGLSIDGTVLDCCFVPDSIEHFEDLHSRYIHINNVPTETSQEQLCNILSVVASPSHCQLSTDGSRFAVIEYSSAAEAELTVNSLRSSGCKMNLVYCAPGFTSMEVLKRLMAAHCPLVGGLAPPTAYVAPPTVCTETAPTVCPLVVNLLQNNPQALKAFQQLLICLHANTLQQRGTGTGGGSGTGTTSTAGSTSVQLMNPSMQLAVLSVLLASQMQQMQSSSSGNNPTMQQLFPNQVLPLISGSMLLQANALMDTLYTQQRSSIPTFHFNSSVATLSTAAATGTTQAGTQVASKLFRPIKGRGGTLPPSCSEYQLRVDSCVPDSRTVDGARPGMIDCDKIPAVQTASVASNTVSQRSNGLPQTGVTASTITPTVLPVVPCAMSVPSGPHTAAVRPPAMMSQYPVPPTVMVPGVLAPTAFPPPALWSYQHPTGAVQPVVATPTPVTGLIQPTVGGLFPGLPPGVVPALPLPPPGMMPNGMPSMPPSSGMVVGPRPGVVCPLFAGVTGCVAPVVSGKPVPGNSELTVVPPSGNVAGLPAGSVNIPSTAGVMTRPNSGSGVVKPVTAGVGEMSNVGGSVVCGSTNNSTNNNNNNNNKLTADINQLTQTTHRPLKVLPVTTPATQLLTTQLPVESQCEVSCCSKLAELPVGGASCCKQQLVSLKNNIENIITTTSHVVTPIGHKRPHRPNFVPAPEPSPESGYVGQHSQGIGGHYADSYVAKRRKFIL